MLLPRTSDQSKSWHLLGQYIGLFEIDFGQLSTKKKIASPRSPTQFIRKLIQKTAPPSHKMLDREPQVGELVLPEIQVRELGQVGQVGDRLQVVRREVQLLQLQIEPQVLRVDAREIVRRQLQDEQVSESFQNPGFVFGGP